MADLLANDEINVIRFKRVLGFVILCFIEKVSFHVS